MKRSRLLLLVSGVLAALLVGGAVGLFSAAFQTWAVRRYLAGHPDIRVTVGEVSAGLNRVELSDVVVAHVGGVLIVPRAEIDLPVFTALWDQRFHVSRCVAKGWSFDLSAAPSVPASAAGPGSVPPAPVPAVPAASGPASTPASAPLNGFLSRLALPVELRVDGLHLEGTVVLPEARGRAALRVQGGGLGLGREGRFEIVADSALADPAVSAVQARGRVLAVMDTPRTFSRMSVEWELAARGTRFPAGIGLQVNATATRTSTGESFVAGLASDGRELMHATAELAQETGRLGGQWRVGLRTADLRPFALGWTLPETTLAGEGSFETEATLGAWTTTGRLQASAGNLGVIRPELAALGTLSLAADLAVARRDGVTLVRSVDLAVSRAGAAATEISHQPLLAALASLRGTPVATIRTSQPFQYHEATGEFSSADATRSLLTVGLRAVPVAWIRPWLPGLEISGGDLHGELTVLPRTGGATVRATVPLTIGGLSLRRGADPWIRDVDVALTTSADYTPQGWQAEVQRLVMAAGGAEVVVLSAKAGQLAGRDRSIKATGELTAKLPALLAQPALAGRLALADGDARVKFVLSSGDTTAVEAEVGISKLAAAAPNGNADLPSLSAQVRMDLAADGRIALSAPIVLERGERKSDFAVSGSVARAADGSRSIDAEVQSSYLVFEDVRSLGILAPEEPAPVPASGSAARPPRPPPWAGLAGSIALRLKQVVYSDSLSASNVTGRIRLDAGIVRLEGLQAGLGEAGQAQVDGRVTFDATQPQPYALDADVAVREFDPAPLFRALGPDQTATIEGKFELTSRLTSSAPSLATLVDGAGGRLQLTSKGGVFRLLPVNVKTIAETTGKFAALIASAGSALSAMAGRKDYADVPNRAQAVAELVKGLNPIRFDQLSVVMARDEALTTTLRDFTLISPEVRLSGAGVAKHRPGTCLLEDALDLEFTLRARGRQGDLLKYLGALEAQPDDLGYTACTVPLKVAGTVARPDTSDLNNRFTSLAIEKSGLSEFATELLNRIRGTKQPN